MKGLTQKGQESESDDLYMEVDVEGRSWIMSGSPEKAEGLANWVDALVKTFSFTGHDSIRVDVTMTDPVYKSWTFWVPDDESYERFEEKLDQKEEEIG